MARGYFVASWGSITDEMVKEYIENQDVEKDDDFKISGFKWASAQDKSIGFSR